VNSAGGRVRAYKAVRGKRSPVNVELSLYGQSRDVIGEKKIEREVPEDTTVRDVFEGLIEEYPDLEGSLLDDGALPPALNVTRNGSSIENDDGLDTVLDGGDEIRIAQSLRGG